MLKGSVLIFLNNLHFILDVKKILNKAIPDTTIETTIQGPQTGLSEDLETNMNIIRHRYHQSSLAFDDYRVGKKSQMGLKILFDSREVDKEVLQELYIFGSSLVNEDLSNIVDWFSKRRDIQEIAWTAIGSPSAKKIIEAKPMGERLPSNSLFLTFGNEGKETPYISSVYLYKLIRLRNERGIDPILPIIDVEDQNFSTNRLAVFSDAKQVLLLEGEQTKYFNMITNNTSKTEIKVEKENQAPYFVFSTDQVRTTYEIQSENKTTNIDLNIEISGVVEESFDVLDDQKKMDYEKKSKKK
ncbi:hypothetical protein FVO58_04485 [Metabacillus halosaccharovorans]|nr:hypothetical protein [Metabacillus halosaccharovorans]